MTPVFKSQLFETDYAGSALYLCGANPSAALRFTDAVEVAIEMLASHPEMGPVWRDGNPQRPTRFLLVPGFHNFLIFYRYENGEVHLGRLLHGAQDLGDELGS